MKRRHFLVASAAATLARPAFAQTSASGARVLRFVPEGNLQNPDPVWTTTTVARNHGYMIWDTLYGLDSSLTPQPQMVAGHELSDDRLTWRFTLRDGLMFHDGEPVRAVDCVTSIRRWARRRGLGQRLLEVAEDIRPLDDKRFEVRLKKPYALLTTALADNCFVMPERIARTDPFKQIQEYIGSGPYRFLRNEWISGSLAVYARNDKYQPRSEPPDFTSGGKVANFDRVEWKIMPDPATAAAALQAGEVDWVQQPLFDLLPMLRKAPGVQVAVFDKLGVMGMLALNHIQPPFDNPKLRRALWPAIDQKEFMSAALGEEADLYMVPEGVFTPHTPMATDAGLEVLSGPRDVEKAKRLVAESGYKGEKVILMSPSDYPTLQALAQVARDTFQRIGINVDYASMDWGTLVQRRTSHEAPDHGGWGAFCTSYEGLSVATPASHFPMRGNGKDGWFGWPTSPRMEQLRDAWFDAPDLAAQKKICAEMQMLAWDEVPFIPLGQYFYPTAFRTSLSGIVKSPFPIFWGVKKA